MIKNVCLCIVSLLICCVCCAFIYKFNSVEDIVTQSSTVIDNSYYNYLYIPKINLKKELLPVDHISNNIEENVTVLSGSTFPDSTSSSLFLAAHSGYGEIAFFNYIHLLEKDDVIVVMYNNIEYFYSVVYNSNQPKDGDIEVNRFSDHQLVLTTCSVEDDKLQTVVVAIKN